MGEKIDRRYLMMRKFMRIREERGEVAANKAFSQEQHDEIFNYIVAAVGRPENYDPTTGGHIIPKHL